MRMTDTKYDLTPTHAVALYTGTQFL